MFFNLVLIILMDCELDFKFFQIRCFEFNDLGHEVFFLKKKLYNPFYYQGIQILWSRSLVWWDISDWLRSDYQDYKFVMTGIFFWSYFTLFRNLNLIPQWSTYTKASLKDFYMNCLAYATKIDIFFFKKKLLNKYNDKTYIDIDIYKTLYL